MPHFVVTDEIPFGPQWVRKLPNGSAYSLHAVVINKSMMEMTDANLGKSITPKLETIVAHEFSHLKHDFGMADKLAMNLPWLLPLVAVESLYLYNHARKKTPHSPTQSDGDYARKLTASINAVSSEDIRKTDIPAPADTWHKDPRRERKIKETARYISVGALTALAGLFISREASLAREFRADKFAVELTGNKEIYKKMLVDMEDIWEKAFQENKFGASFTKRFLESLKHIVENFTQAHPSTEQRIKFIDRLKSTQTGLSPG